MNEREKQEYNDAWARFYATKEAAKPKKRTKSKTGNSTKENENVSQSQKHDYVLNYKAPVSKRITRFLQEKWYVILCAIGLIIANFVIPAMYKTLNEDPLQRFVGTYTFSDDINHRFIVTVKEGGDAIVKMDRSSVGDSYIEQAAWGKAMRGIKCVWDTIYASKGGRSIESISVEGDGVEFFFCDGYAYLDYYDFSKMRNGKRYSFEK